jgi:hypothetical protein
LYKIWPASEIVSFTAAYVLDLSPPFDAFPVELLWPERTRIRWVVSASCDMGHARQLPGRNRRRGGLGAVAGNALLLYDRNRRYDSTAATGESIVSGKPLWLISNPECHGWPLIRSEP